MNDDDLFALAFTGMVPDAFYWWHDQEGEEAEEVTSQMPPEDDLVLVIWAEEAARMAVTMAG